MLKKKEFVGNLIPPNDLGTIDNATNADHANNLRIINRIESSDKLSPLNYRLNKKKVKKLLYKTYYKIYCKNYITNVKGSAKPFSCRLVVATPYNPKKYFTKIYKLRLFALKHKARFRRYSSASGYQLLKHVSLPKGSMPNYILSAYRRITYCKYKKKLTKRKLVASNAFSNAFSNVSLAKKQKNANNIGLQASVHLKKKVNHLKRLIFLTKLAGYLIICFKNRHKNIGNFVITDSLSKEMLRLLTYFKSKLLYFFRFGTVVDML